MATALDREREARLAAVRRRTAIELQRQLDEGRPHPFRWFMVGLSAAAILAFVVWLVGPQLIQFETAFSLAHSLRFF